MSSTITAPTSVIYTFASQASGAYVSTIPVNPTGNAHASWKEGFPAITMTPSGSPPYGADFNGVLQVLSSYAQWQVVGGPWRFDSTLATAAGGYPVGSVVRDASSLNSFINNSNGNALTPETAANIVGSAGWDFYSQAGPGTTFGRVMKLADTSINDNVILLTSATYTAYKGGLADGTIVVWANARTNTGACTLNLNGNATSPALVTNKGAALIAGDIVAGRTYAAVYDSTTSKFVMIPNVTSQDYPVLFSTQHNVTGARSSGSVYPSAPLSVPMMVNVVAVSTAINQNLILAIDGATVAEFGQPNNAAEMFVSAIVPPGKTYVVTCAGTLQSWIETY